MEENKNVTEEEFYDLGYDWMMKYGYNVNLARAIPQISDGLKPIHRRTLYGLWKSYKYDFVSAKSAIGIIGLYVPHGDQGMNLMLGRMAQSFSNTVPLLTPKGNPGTITCGDDTAAQRYWSIAISDFVKDVYFSEFDEKANMVPNYDDKLMEPTMLPCKFPMILLNGTIGIGYTMSSTIPPYNLNELADVTLKLLDNPDAKFRLIPDSPTGCDIIIRDENTFVMQSSFEIDNLNYTITIRNTPYTKFIRKIQKDIWKLQDSKNAIPEILHADDESDLINNDNIKFIIRCKPCNLYTIINKLFKYIPDFRYTISTKNMIVVDTEYRTCNYNVRQILLAWIKIRINEKRNWYMRELTEKTHRYNMLDGKAFMLNKENLPKTIKVFRSCKHTDEIVSKLVESFKGKISSSQANFISDAKFKHLTEDEYNKTLDEIKKLYGEIEEIRKTISSKENIMKSIADDIRKIKAKYGHPRRSKIINPNNTEHNNIAIAQIMSDGSVVFSETETPEHLASDVTPISDNKVCLIDELSQFIWVDTNKIQHGSPITLTSVGKCVMGKCKCVCSNTNNNILMVTNHGRVKLMAIGGIPSNASKKPLIPGLNDGEEIVSILELSDNDDDVLIYTKDGMGKRVKTSDMYRTSINSQGQFLIKNVDNVSGMFLINDNKPLLVYVTLLGRVRVNNAKFLVSGKKYGDIKPIIKLSPQDDLVAVFCVNKNDVVQLNHADGRVSTVNIESLPVTTMATPPERPKHVPATKLVRAIIL